MTQCFGHFYLLSTSVNFRAYDKNYLIALINGYNGEKQILHYNILHTVLSKNWQNHVSFINIKSLYYFENMSNPNKHNLENKKGEFLKNI